MIVLGRVVAAGGIVLSLLLYFAVPAVHRAVSGLTMALTQRSVQAVAGAILNVGGLGVLKAIVLITFQTVVLPWLLPYSVGGAVLAFGRFFGAAVSMIGALMGVCIWFGIIRLFLKDALQRGWASRLKLHCPTGLCLTVAVNLLTMGMLCIPAAAAGASRISLRRFLLFAIIAELPIVICFAVYCNAYRALLPNLVETILSVAAILLLLAGTAIEVDSRRKEILSERRRGQEKKEKC